ncbi:MAG TPA: Ppx/GppA phosphatase family protein [Thermohalobaculum sp.]|nr:Ppx/GppA phosphatase family protein [Thermohalobaculum sp.]
MTTTPNPVENGIRGTGRRGRPSAPGASRDGVPAIAALDLGTNNCRLLVARPEGESFVVIDAFSRAVRLGEGVGRSNELSDEAQARAVKALRICAAKLRRHGVVDARIVATEACRRAGNAAAFLRRVGRELGLRLEIISAEEEARLAVAGCAPLIDAQAEHLMVFDIGGGSTELIWVDMSRTPPSRRVSLIRALAPAGRNGAEDANARAAAAHVTDWISIPLGVSTLHDLFTDVTNSEARFAAMSRHFGNLLAPFAPFRSADRAALAQRLQIIGVSGTATTFGALHLGLRTYDRSQVDGLWLSRDAAAAVAGRLVATTGAPQAPRVFARGKTGLMLSGAAILMTILTAWPVERMRIADRGLREGMLYGLLHQRRIAR